MNDQNNTTPGRVEGLLRQWGADEAANQAAAELAASPAVSKAPMREPKPRRSPMRTFFRWIPAGLAASLLLAASIVFMRTGDFAPQMSHAPAYEHNVDSALATSQPEDKTIDPIVDLSDELAAAIQDAADARMQAQALQTELTAVKAGENSSDATIKKLLTEKAALAAKLAHKVEMDKAYDILLAKSEQNTREIKTKLETKLEAAQKELADALAARPKAPDNSKELAAIKARLTVAIGELKRQQATFRAASLETAKAKEALASLKVRQNVAFDQLRRVYLAAAAPGKTRIAALQTAMKNRCLLDRCTVLQRKVRNDADKKLLARAEVVLMRFGLLDVSDPSAVKAYGQLLAKSDIIASLDAALGQRATDAETQDWLFETKLILTGVQRIA